MTVISILLASLVAGAAPAAVSDSCALGAGDQAWLDRSMKAWNYASVHISGIGHVKKIQAVIFDKQCVVTSSTAMNGGRNSWTGKRHGGSIALPDGSKIPPTVISFAGGSGPTAFFVMSTPTVWSAGGVKDKGIGLSNLMTAVLLHEATHVAHIPTYGEQIARLAERNHLPEDFNDDSIQDRFGKDADFTRSVENESRLLFEAAGASDREQAAALVRSARDLMNARYARWFTGKDAYLAEAEAIWLTFEGSGQWTGYKWLTDPGGAKLAPAVAWPGFIGDKHWTQGEGFGAFMALERLTGMSWRRQAFHLGQKNVLEMLDEAAARYPARNVP